MNNNILYTAVQHFINKNLTTEITKLILKGASFKGVTVQELAEQITSKKKCKNKLPTWFETHNIYYPNKLNIEQTSSEITANYKANLIQGDSIIDLTGGFGVDCLAFSKKFKQVYHCEINETLSNIVTHNFKQLNTTNITPIIGDAIEILQKQNKKYDCIYIDPSRRDDLKKRVFLLEDCLPNLPENIDLLFDYSDTILVKTAPLLDVNVAINELKFVKEIHVVAINNEVKEVLYLLEKGCQHSFSIKTINIGKEKNQQFNFSPLNTESTYSLPQKYLYEPNASVLKAGAFTAISTRLKIDKLHKHSHLYTSDQLIDFPGRSFKIIKVVPYQPKKLVKVIKIKKANITTRNFPESVAKIRKKTKIKDGGTTYLFFTTNMIGNKVVLVCVK